ncbi:MAG: hypothetical protein IKV07_07125 [Bacteroidaceae bacterium]|nr:hypothetical protein [Bacteroidaceae bacterium]
MSRTFIACTPLYIIVSILFSCSNKKIDTSSVCSSKAVTLYGTSFLKGKVSSIVYDDAQGYDSILFVYNSKQHPVKTISYSNGEENGHCKYYYNGSNRIDLHYYDNNQKETSYSIVEFDNNKNITLCRDYGYIFPDTTKMIMQYMMQNSYDKDNRITDAFEYHCDGIPPYKYRYTYNNDGTETIECFLAVTGDIYAITKVKKDKNGNIIEKSENMPWDTREWTNIKIEYMYDDKDNWIERKIIDEDPESYRNKYSKRRIHYLSE